MSSRERTLTPEELALWDHVTRNVKRASARTHTVPPLTAAPTPPPTSGTKVQPVARGPAPRPPAAPPLTLGDSDNMDRRTARRFARGEMSIDARLDLHGLGLAQAENAVTQFIHRAAAADYRCVLVVTGKGRRGAEAHSDSPARGRIRAETPHWLNKPSLRPLILAVREAHFKHGGGGALYVLLKRRRS
jgi:DNA-nicking Smr family endonuclease